ncbi:MAG: D-alanyl-D-alanine carboxypeptidase/D-alanyl-D-alanine-endopeptidase [Bacteroidales bacterium]|nr:D-alanyl-D-alanine carboxypeptidase/D-alanyl-D-alanine-endopeptidase [Bacteroidales bacterium]
MKHSKLLTLIMLPLAALLTTPAAAQSNVELDRAVKSVSNEECMKHATVAVSVYNISRGRTVYGNNAQRSMIPASMHKIFVTAIAFDQLGGNFRFKTTLAHDGTIDDNGTLNGNIYIVGGGDPLLGSYRYRQTTPDSVFRTWYTAIHQSGIRKVNGQVCYVQSIYDNLELHDSWQWGDIGNYYGAGACGLNFHENMYFVYFNAGMRLGYPASLERTDPRNVTMRNINEVSTGPEGTGDRVIIYGAPNSSQRLYRGTVPLGSRNFAVRGALPNPAATCAESFSTYLRQQGISISASVKEAATLPPSSRTLLEYQSTPFNILAQYINRTSNNIYAESVFKYLGYDRYGKGSFANASKAIHDFFRTHSLDDSGIQIADGCGLSRSNLTTSDFTCRFLTEISKMMVYDDFVKTMAVAGKNGTARNILTSLPQGTTMYIKSGTMEGVKAYCGYVTTARGEQLCYCVISNNHTCSSATVTKKLERILNQIALLN